MNEQNKKYRNFVLTINNPEDHEELVHRVKNAPYKYLVWGNEVGEEGTPHKQGTIIFSSPKTMSAALKVLVGIHYLKPCIDLFKSIEYCKKTNEYEEYGTPPKTSKEKGQGEQNKWKEVRIAAEEGRLDDIPDDIRFRQYKAVEHFRSEGSKRRKLADTDSQHLWYYGDSGTGKSKKAREENPECYLKMCNKWWDGYSDEEVVVIEDFDTRHEKLVHHMKLWSDRYPFLAETKGGARKIRPKLIIVTSNYSPDEIWHTGQDLDPILRRFKKVHFPLTPFTGRASGPTTAPAGANTANLDEQMK